jgi:hypothetical protein
MCKFTMVFFTGCPFLVATGHKSCCCDGTPWYFTQQIWEFIKMLGVFKLFLGLCNLREICVSNMVSNIWHLSFHLMCEVCT